jgi:excisionase family DNA binding protein
MKMYLTIEEVAQSLRVTVPTVRWLRQEGRFAPAIKVGRRVLWDDEALTAWLEANREAPSCKALGARPTPRRRMSPG